MSQYDPLFENFQKLSKLDRKYIAFMRDEDYEKEISKNEKLDGWRRKNSTFGFYLSLPWYSVPFGYNPMWHIAVEAGFIVMNIVRNKKNQLGVRFLPSSISDNFVLPPAEASLRQVYVKDPVQKLNYHAFDGFHSYVFDSKHQELNRLLVSLGATKITEKWIQGWGLDVGASVDVDTVDENKASVKYNVKEDSKNTKITIMEPRGVKPSIPEDLKWFEWEPKWQEYADKRINGKCKLMTVIFDYSQSYGVTASAKTTLQKAGFGVGVDFKRYEKTIYELEVEFE